MRENLFLVASQVGTLFLMMAVGFVLARLGKLTRDDYALIQTALSNPEKLNDIIKSKQGQNKK